MSQPREEQGWGVEEEEHPGVGQEELAQRLQGGRVQQVQETERVCVCVCVCVCV